MTSDEPLTYKELWEKNPSEPRSFIGTKLIDAKPYSLETEDNGVFKVDPGFLVKYEDGYISWSPKDAFQKAYRLKFKLTFGEAIEAAKIGLKISRAGWNGKGMWVVLQKAYPNGIAVNKNTAEATGMKEGELARFRPYLMMKTADGTFVPWLASQSDVLDEDWSIVE